MEKNFHKQGVVGRLYQACLAASFLVLASLSLTVGADTEQNPPQGGEKDSALPVKEQLTQENPAEASIIEAARTESQLAEKEPPASVVHQTAATTEQGSLIATNQQALAEAKVRVSQVLKAQPLTAEQETDFLQELESADGLEEVEEIWQAAQIVAEKNQNEEAVQMELQDLKTKSQYTLATLNLTAEERADFETQLTEALSKEIVDHIVLAAKMQSQRHAAERGLSLDEAKRDARAVLQDFYLSKRDWEEFSRRIEAAESAQELDDLLQAAQVKSEENRRPNFRKSKNNAYALLHDLDLTAEERMDFEQQIAAAKRHQELESILATARAQAQNNRLTYHFDQPIEPIKDSYDHSKTLSDPVSTLQAFKQGDDVPVSFAFANSSEKRQKITARLELFYANQRIGQALEASFLLRSGDSVDVGKSADLQKIFTIPAGWLKDNTGYNVKVSVLNQMGAVLDYKVMGLSVESDWTKFPRYGTVAGSQDYNNSIVDSPETRARYAQEFEQMKNMHINAHFYYDVYKNPTEPLSPDDKIFQQEWNWWSKSQVDTTMIKKLVEMSHEDGAKALLYNMISARTNFDKPIPVQDDQLVYNYEDNYFGKKGTPMTNPMLKDGEDLKVYQEYYNPASPSWQAYIARTMQESMDCAQFDGWQGDTIGDARVNTSECKDSTDIDDSFLMSDTYAHFTDRMKEMIPDKYFTLNAVGAQGLKELAKSKQDVVYTEVWANGDRDDNKTGTGRFHTEYGDLKRLVDQVRDISGKSLIMAAYMELPGDGNPSAQDEYFQTDAALLVDATVAAAGGYHMTVSANANSKHQYGVGILDAAYYSSQGLKVSEELNRKLYNYQQFITAYENLLRGDGVTNDERLAQVFSRDGQQLSYDDNNDPEKSGICGHQVWIFTKKGQGFQTIQLINLTDIHSDWTNKAGMSENKTPTEQKDLLIRYPLTGLSKEEAEVKAASVYLASPDDWAKGDMKRLQARVENIDGTYNLLIDVPQLTLWDMIYLPD